jgi:hypothetical protein
MEQIRGRVSGKDPPGEESMQHAASRLAAFALLAAAAWAQPAKTAGHWQGETKIGEPRAVSGVYRGTLGASGEIAGEGPRVEIARSSRSRGPRSSASRGHEWKARGKRAVAHASAELHLCARGERCDNGN